MAKLNPQEAPPGFRAEEATQKGIFMMSCAGCYFFEKVPPAMYRSRACPTHPCCLAEERADGREVIFVKESEQEKPCPS